MYHADMSSIETTRESRALQAISTLCELDGALDDPDLSLNEASGHLIMLSRSLGNDSLTTSRFYHHEIAPDSPEIGRIRHNLAAIGILLPLRYPSEEAFRTIAEHPGYMPAAIDLMGRALDTQHEDCPLSVRDAIYSQQPARPCRIGSQNCEKRNAVRFILGTDMSIDQRMMYAMVYGSDYETFRRAAADELRERGSIGNLIHSMAHTALAAAITRPLSTKPRHLRDEP